MITNCVVDAVISLRQARPMLDTDALLQGLRAKNPKNVDVARVLGLPDSRIPEIYRKDRKLSLDEGAKLVQAFELEPDRGASPLPAAILRLVVQYVALKLGAPLEANRGRVDELTEDLRAFSEFVSDPKVRRSIEAAEGYFHALLRPRPGAGPEAQPETDPEQAH